MARRRKKNKTEGVGVSVVVLIIIGFIISTGEMIGIFISENRNFFIASLCLAVKYTSICKYFCGVKYLDSILCSYPYENIDVLTDDEIDRPLIKCPACGRQHDKDNCKCPYLKICAIINNANRVLEIQNELGSFDKYIWSFTNGKTIKNRWKSIDEVPASTQLSDVMSKDMKNRGFRFVGTTIIYAFLQAVGVVNDHETCCFCYEN